jgi:porphobilinogen synthase
MIRTRLAQLIRPRRLRRTETLRALVREHRVDIEQLVQPLFVVENSAEAGPIASMPGIRRYTVETAVQEAGVLEALGVRSVLLFGIPETKDAVASSNYDPNGVVQQAAREIKAAFPHVLVIADLCNCEYTSHGHCGIVDERGDVDNDATVELLVRTALTYAHAGVDVIAPSDMMDGRVKAIREALDREGFEQIPIMAYSAKYASAFYGPAECARGNARDRARHRRRRGYRHGQAGAAVYGHRARGARSVRRSDRRVQRQRRVRDAESGCAERVDR